LSRRADRGSGGNGIAILARRAVVVMCYARFGGPEGFQNEALPLVDNYHVVVTRHGPHWEWELYRNGEPLPARVREGFYKSEGTAKSAGKIALYEFLRALNRELDLDR
jgi:hypothetical protein